MSEPPAPILADDLLKAVNDVMVAEATRLKSTHTTLDLAFYAYLRIMSRFGFFSFGPLNIEVSLIEDIVEATTPRLGPDDDVAIPPMSDDYVRFSERVMEEVRSSGRRRIDELHFLLAFMRSDEGLPKRVFGELGVTPEQVEEFARHPVSGSSQMERLYSPEEAAAYLNVHVQTVRAWIRSGRLRARRLAGQRALRIKATDLQSVLEPLELATDLED